MAKKINSTYLFLFVVLVVFAVILVGILVNQAYQTDLYFGSAGQSGSTLTTQDAF